jgi:hypothetical protein
MGSLTVPSACYTLKLLFDPEERRDLFASCQVLQSASIKE